MKNIWFTFKQYLFWCTDFLKGQNWLDSFRIVWKNLISKLFESTIPPIHKLSYIFYFDSTHVIYPKIRRISWDFEVYYSDLMVIWDFEVYYSDLMVIYVSIMGHKVKNIFFYRLYYRIFRFFVWIHRLREASVGKNKEYINFNKKTT